MMEVLQVESHRHLHEPESNRRMIQTCIHIVLETHLQPLAGSCHWSETARRLVAAERRPLQVVWGNLIKVADNRSIVMLSFSRREALIYRILS